MDTKRLVIGMALAMALVFGLEAFRGYMYRQHPEWTPVSSTQPAVPPSTPQANLPLASAQAPSTSSQPTVNLPTSALQVVNAPAQGQTISLGSTQKNDPTFTMGLTLSPLGAGINSITLNQFQQKVGSDDRYVFQQPYFVADPLAADSTRSLATQSITVNGQTFNLANTPWQLESHSPNQATYFVDLATKSSQPLLRIRKIFSIPARTDAQGKSDPTGGYEILVRYTFENLSAQPITVKTAFNGPTVPPRELDRNPDRLIVAGYNVDPKDPLINLASHTLESFTKDKASLSLLKNDKGFPMVWAGANSAYFDAIVLPVPLASTKSATPQYLQDVKAESLEPNTPEHANNPVVITFTTTDLTVAPGAASALSLDLRVFFGPKQRKLLANDYYLDYPRSYEVTLTSGSSCAWCTFQPIVTGLVWLLTFFHMILRDWGLAIIALVVVVRLALHPITKKSTLNMHKMGKMGPEMERLKKKYGDNKEELNKAMMQVYKEQGLAPILGCLPMFLQMPIWIALWSALQGTFELRQAPFLQIGSLHLTWISDLAKPDHLFYFPNHPINLYFFTLNAINLLPVLLGVVFFLQQKFTPKPPASTPEQAQQQKMMQWMSLLFPVMLYTGPSGLNLYILTSTTIGIIESKRVRDHIQAQEAAEKEGRVIIDAKPTRGSRHQKDLPAPAPKKGGLMGWLASLQARAEQIRHENEKKPPRK